MLNSYWPRFNPSLTRDPTLSLYLTLQTPSHPPRRDTFPKYLSIVGAINGPRTVSVFSDINVPVLCFNLFIYLFFPEGLPCITHHRCMYKDCFLLLKAADMHAQLPVQRAIFSLFFTSHSLFPSSAFHCRPQQSHT